MEEEVLRVLIIDSDDSRRRLFTVGFKKRFREAGCHVVEAQNGYDAIDILSGPDRVHLFIFDSKTQGEIEFDDFVKGIGGMPGLKIDGCFDCETDEEIDSGIDKSANLDPFFEIIGILLKVHYGI